MLSQSLFKKTAHPLFFIKVSLVVTKKHMSKGQNCLVNTVRCVNDNMFRGGGVKWESHWAKLILNVSFIHRTLFYFHTLASNPLALLVIPPKKLHTLKLVCHMALYFLWEEEWSQLCTLYIHNNNEVRSQKSGSGSVWVLLFGFQVTIIHFLLAN